MYTVSDIITDINRGIVANNLAEDCFSYRIFFFVRESNKSYKHYIDTSYDGLRDTLENIVKENLSLTNNVVIAAVTVWKGRKSVCLQSRSYGFSLDEYFRSISGERRDNGRNGNIMYRRYAVR